MGQKRRNDEIINLENIKRVKIEKYEGKATIQDIPVEIMWLIIDYLDSDGFLSLRSLCRSISETLNVIFYHCYNKIPKKIISARKKLYDRLYCSDLEDQVTRMDVTKSLLQLLWIETELTSLESIILRYNVNSECLIFTQLWPILKEILESVDILMIEDKPLTGDWIGPSVDNLSLSLPLWSKFIEEFDSHLEPTFAYYFPFEIRVIDILTCCPTSNASITLKRSKDGTVDVKAFFQIQDSLTESLISEFDSCPPNIEDKKAIFKMFRFIVRKSNSTYLTNVLNDVKILNENLQSNTDDEKVMTSNEKYRQLLSFLYKPIISIENSKNGSVSFIRRNTYNVSSNFMECSLERNNLEISHVPLIAIYPQLYNIQTAQNTSHSLGGSMADTENINPAFKIRWFKKD